ncbi:hypothetical protein ACFPK5_39625 [Streptomyces beijiangensis]|uniref:hypothetical protein n=1 Tax=Streptomyces beijiangensis TaxID=163361 RepID=UPI003608010E
MSTWATDRSGWLSSVWAPVSSAAGMPTDVMVPASSYSTNARMPDAPQAVCA